MIADFPYLGHGVGLAVHEDPRLSSLNHKQLKAGMAWWYREYAKEQSPEVQRAYDLAEQDARAARRGLWKDAKPVPPWEWRRRQTN